MKPVPPRNVSVSSSEELSSILKLTWVNSSIDKFIGLKYDIQYRARGTAAWSQVPALPVVTASRDLPPRSPPPLSPGTCANDGSSAAHPKGLLFLPI